ncbi:MAG: C39 family peptidase [Ruminococcus sp.]|nr:C39 family peptidase [Ruminococcus sp.]
MKKLVCAAIAAIICTASVTSCKGRILRLEGENVVEGATIASTLPPVTTAPVTTAATEPVTEPTEATNEYGAPLRIEIDTAMPEDYELGTKCAVNVDALLQTPELPTGCEITALTELLNFYGFSADKVEMADIFMANDQVGYYTMNDAYLGDPRSNNGFGCNAPVIVRAADDYFSYLGSDWYAVNITGSPIEAVYYQIEQGRPAVVWTTINQAETHKEYEFTLGCGEDLNFNPMQHCVVVYGFDFEAGVVHVADPLAGNVTYEIERFTRIYESMDRQAVVLCGNEESAGADYTTAEQKEGWIKATRLFEEDSRIWFRKNLDVLNEPKPAAESADEEQNTTEEAS